MVPPSPRARRTGFARVSGPGFPHFNARHTELARFLTPRAAFAHLSRRVAARAFYCRAMTYTTGRCSRPEMRCYAAPLRPRTTSSGPYCACAVAPVGYRWCYRAQFGELRTFNGNTLNGPLSRKASFDVSGRETGPWEVFHSPSLILAVGEVAVCSSTVQMKGREERSQTSEQASSEVDHRRQPSQYTTAGGMNSGAKRRRQIRAIGKPSGGLSKAYQVERLQSSL